MATRATILLIDDDPDFLSVTAEVLEYGDYICITSDDGLTLAADLETHQPQLVLTDFRLPGKDGLEVLRDVKRHDAAVPVIVLSGHDSVTTAVEMTKAGAFDYLTKPVDPDQLLLRVARALESQSLVKENAQLKERLKDTHGLERMVGDSRQMRQIFHVIERVAPSEANVLIHGESGTGKELVARAIHELSPRARAMFVPIDCVALPANLIESELFGHEAGAFTGATQRKDGLLASAGSGTVFLDEITELPIELQAKLLRVLQERAFRRVGGRDLIPMTARIVAATNRDPEAAVAEGTFREDLYYRLNVVPIKLPALRERRDDIPMLLNHYLRLHRGSTPDCPASFAPDAMDSLQQYPWPGNVRELEHMVHRLAILSVGETITRSDLPAQITGSDGDQELPADLLAMPYKDARRLWLERFERLYLTDLLDRHDGNISQAAQSAGIDRKTIHRLLNDLGLSARD